MQPVLVLAGGLGTRVAHLVGNGEPKALLPVGDRAFMDVKLAELAAAGAVDVVMLVGHGARTLEAHVGDGSRFGLRISWVVERAGLLGTGGAVRAALPEADPFWVTYGDTLLEVPLRRVEAQLTKTGLLGVMTVLENRDRWEPSNADVEDGLVTAYRKGDPPGTHRFLDYGMLLLRRSAFDGPEADPFDLGEVLRRVVDQRQLGAYRVRRRFYDVGTEESWRETDRWVRRHRRNG